MATNRVRSDNNALLPRVEPDDFVVTELAEETLGYDLRANKAHCLS